MSDKPDRPIDAARAELAVNFLAHTDEQVAQLKVDAKRFELKVKKVKAAIFLTIGGNVEERKSSADIDAETVKAEEVWLEAEQKYETLKNRRDTAVLVWEHWRSLNSARSKGMVV